MFRDKQKLRESNELSKLDAWTELMVVGWHVPTTIQIHFVFQSVTIMNETQTVKLQIRRLLRDRNIEKHVAKSLDTDTPYQ